MRSPIQVVLATLPLACGGGSDSPSGDGPSSSPVPRTVDKGDGCTVVITKDGTGPVARIGDEIAIAYVASVKEAEPADAKPTEPTPEAPAESPTESPIDPPVASNVLPPVAPPIASTEGWDVPLRIRLGDPGVLPGLARGIEGLAAGTTARIEIPPELGYGGAGNPSAGVPADATLVFEVEILGVAR